MFFIRVSWWEWRGGHWFHGWRKIRKIYYNFEDARLAAEVAHSHVGVAHGSVCIVAVWDPPCYIAFGS